MPGVLPAHDILGPMFGPHEDATALLAQLNDLSRSGDIAGVVQNEPGVNQDTPRDYPTPPQEFVTWLASEDSSGINEVGDSLLAAYHKNPDSAGMLWRIVQGLAVQEPDALPPDLVLMTQNAGTEPVAVPQAA